MTRKRVKIQIRELLVRRGLCTTPDEAGRWIMAGKVIVNDQRIEKAGELVSEKADVRIRGMCRYVGKGGQKLEGALSDFAFKVAGQTVLDAGASTGGFTDCLLQHEARRVYAVDVGHGTLAGQLRRDERVVNLENTNISDLTSADLEPLPSLATVDLSYLSLRKAIPIVAALLDTDGQMICLVKPLFEISDPEARRLGRITAPSAYGVILKELVQFTESLAFGLLGMTHSRVRGNRGTLEFFIWLSKDGTRSAEIASFDRVVKAALRLPE